MFLVIIILMEVGDFVIMKFFLLWINDGFMVLFFFLVGFEIKCELFEGELFLVDKVLLFVIVVVGGMVVFVIVYIVIVLGNLDFM